MRYVIILDAPLLMHPLSGIANEAEEMLFIVPHQEGTFTEVLLKGEKICRADLLDKDTYRRLLITEEDRLILHARRRETLDEILHNLLSVCETVPVVVLLTDAEETPPLGKSNISYLVVNELLQKNVEKEWSHIRNRERTQKIRELTQGAENILILTQHDPDPDALASGLALRTLLGRNRTTAPLASFGTTTRSENLSMLQLLDIRYTVIDPQALNSYSLIAMVDVQPPYFGEKVPRADIIFDHHPPSANYECLFKDIRAQYGATSTMLTEYFISNGIRLHQRIATALFYGIKSDTFMLEREANPADVEAFTYLYPIANHNLIRQMEHPSLDPEEVSSFMRALRRRKVIDKVLFAHIGRVNKEDIIPRLADFCLQVGGAEWSIVSGLFRKDLVISIRNVGYVKHAGEVVKKIFSESGSAGGHRTMAKVVIPLAHFKRAFAVANNKDIDDTIANLFGKVISDKVS
jgi:nanoRNase/pAp phosphatase (c-di-AMP/oligoRNAs hydrolase)